MENMEEIPLTRAQRKKLKKEKRHQERDLAEKERITSLKKKKIRNYAIALLIVIAIVWFFYWKSIPPENAPVLTLEKASYNFGEVSQRDGVVSKMLSLSNEGEGDLIISGMVTSCMCTAASLIYNGKESPTFGMHTKPTGWRESIKPGETAQLKIDYDPNAHPELRGPVTRIITISSNDPRSPRKDVKIYLNQVT